MTYDYPNDTPDFFMGTSGFLSPDAPWWWNIDLHLPQTWTSFVGSWILQVPVWYTIYHQLPVGMRSKQTTLLINQPMGKGHQCLQVPIFQPNNVPAAVAAVAPGASRPHPSMGCRCRHRCCRCPPSQRHLAGNAIAGEILKNCGMFMDFHGI